LVELLVVVLKENIFRVSLTRNNWAIGHTAKSISNWAIGHTAKSISVVKHLNNTGQFFLTVAIFWGYNKHEKSVFKKLNKKKFFIYVLER